METKSIKKFKEELVKILPFFPNNKETKEELLSQSISSVMFYYIHWLTRLVPNRSRKVFIEPYVAASSRWPVLKPEIDKLLSKVRDGEDLTPFLSLKAHQKGYTPADRIRSGEAKSSDDKDFLLNTMGFHHFHLDEHILPSGMSERTHDVLFARITRYEFHAVAIFNHSVFESDRDENDEMNDERKRLWEIFDEYSTRGMAPGTVYTPSMITMSGHPLHIHDITREYTHVLNEIDHKITDRDYENGIYNETKLTKPKNNKLAWLINGLDLGLIDKENQFFIFRYGPT
jgi:hypothetical protein